MSEQITGEQLEASSGGRTNTIAHCHECGCDIDVEQDFHGESINGEEYVCYDCHCDVAMISTIKHDDWFIAYSNHGDFPNREEVSTGRFSSPIKALKRAAEMAEAVWCVKSYIERG